MVQLIYIMCKRKVTSSVASTLQIHTHHSRHTPHEQLTLFGDDAANGTVDGTALWERIHDTMRLIIIEKESIVGTYPQPVVVRVKGESTYKPQVDGMARVNRQGPDAVALHRAHAPTPCAYPQRATVVGYETGY